MEFNTMHWVYVIVCEDDVLYVGETTQLVTRLRAHFKGQGSACTRTHRRKRVAAVYRVDRHAAHRDGTDTRLHKPNALWLEQRFVEQLIRVRDLIHIKYPTDGSGLQYL